MRDQVVEFIRDYPFLLVLLPVVVVVGRYRRIKRRAARLNEARSNPLIWVGLVATAVIIGLWLWLSD